MEDISVSKGVFAHAKFKVGQKRKTKRNDYKSQPWYQIFKENWLAIEKAAIDVNTNTFRQILFDLETFVSKVKILPLLEDEIPTGILLAGVNLPDHNLLVNKLTLQLQLVTPHIATVWSRDAGTLKSLIEDVIYQIINQSKQKDEMDSLPEIKKSQCTFCTLHAWHTEYNTPDTPFVIIIPDFESFSSKILHDFILILSSHVKTMKFILIFGVATTLHIVHRSLSYDATSKLKVQVFHTQNKVGSLASILDGIVLSPEIPFKLIGRTFKLLIDVFLYYDFSVNGFLQSYKVCMWKHYYGRSKDYMIICCKQEDINDRISILTSKDIQILKRLPSVSKYCQLFDESKINNNEFKQILIQLLNGYHTYINNFLIILKCLYIFTFQLPNYPLGKLFREFYANAVRDVSICTTSKYHEAIKMIGFLSKDDLLSNINSVLSILNTNQNAPEDVKDKLKYYINAIKNANLDVDMSVSEVETSLYEKCSRLQWTEKLKLNSSQQRRSAYKKVQMEFIEYLDKQVFQKYLINPKQVPLNEVFCYDDLQIINGYMKGPMKAAIHNALNNPGYYLECHCCTKSDWFTYPDLCIIYKFYLERRKMINMYDWLQNFVHVVNPNQMDDQDIDPHLQARFTRAVAELQFLGYIKATRKKTDHVKRLV